MNEQQRYALTQHLLALLLIVAVGLLTACSDDTPEQDGESLRIVSCTRADNSVEANSDYKPLALFLAYANANVEGSYYVAEGTCYNLIGDVTFRQEQSGGSTSKIEVEANTNYAVYGLAPSNAATCGVTATLSGATFSISNLPVVGTKDLCAVVGVQKVTSSSDARDVKLGKFTFVGTKPTNVHLLLDHLLGGIKFQLSIASSYNNLRTIKLRKLTVKTKNGDSEAADEPFIASTTVYITPNETNTNPMRIDSGTGTDSWTITGKENSAEIFNGEETLKPDQFLPSTAPACYIPPVSGVTDSLVLESNFDVYDKQGNLVRENCTAINKLYKLQKVKDLLRGQMIELKLTVNPTYLYQLSEPDLDNPTITL